MNSAEFAQREANLMAAIETKLPEFARLRSYRPHQREPNRTAALCRRIRVAAENCFKAHDLTTAAKAAHKWPRVRHRKASTTVDRMFQRNAADALLSGKCEELRHHRLSLPSLGPPFSRLVRRSGSHILLPSADGLPRYRALSSRLRHDALSLQ
jgi:hypothetical protein